MHHFRVRARIRVGPKSSPPEFAPPLAPALWGARGAAALLRVGVCTKRLEEGVFEEGVLPRLSLLDQAHAPGKPTR
jgi:hypothetical protein